MVDHKCNYKLEIVNRLCLHFTCRICASHICVEKDGLYAALLGYRKVMTYISVNQNRM